MDFGKPVKISISRNKLTIGAKAMSLLGHPSKVKAGLVGDKFVLRAASDFDKEAYSVTLSLCGKKQQTYWGRIENASLNDTLFKFFDTPGTRVYATQYHGLWDAGSQTLVFEAKGGPQK